MSRPWELESFDSANSVSTFPMETSGVQLEEERLIAFDRGYKDGWEDAAKAHAEEQSRISAELASNLQEMSFTYLEARNAVLGEMEGILKGVVSRILPETMVHSLGEMIVERVRSSAESAADIEVEVVVSSGNAERVQDLFQNMIAPPLSVLEEPSLGEGQAFVRLGEAEQKIDLEAVLEGLSDAVSEFFEPTEQLEAQNV